MLIQVLRAKIHRLTVTQHDLDYEGSITLDLDLVERAGFVPHEKVAVWNVSNGSRFETYVIEGRRGGGTVCVNGAAAHLARKGDVIIVAAFGLVELDRARGLVPRVVRVDGANHPLPDTGPERSP